MKNPPHTMPYAERKAFERFQDCYDKCEIYYAYELIHRASTEAFTSIFPGEARCCLCRLLLPRLGWVCSVVNRTGVDCFRLHQARCSMLRASCSCGS